MTADESKNKLSLVNFIYVALLLINNIIASSLLGAAFLTSSSRRYSFIEAHLRLALYGLIISFFFSLLTLGLTYILKRFFSLRSKNLLRVFILQLGVLFIIYIIAVVIVFH
jgi:hypothetical protein